MKVILCDTNVLYGIFVRYNKQLPITHCELKKIAKVHEVWISDFVLDELINVLRRNEGIFASPDVIYGFKQFLWVYIHMSGDIDVHITKYVYDEYDVQILQDAIDIHADIILTRNLKDFDITGIQSRYWIDVVDELTF